MDTVNKFYFASTEVFIAEREKKIREILSRGKIVRFTFKGEKFWKDINDWLSCNEEDTDDLIAFRVSPNCKTYYVGWACDLYEISEIDA